MKLKTPEYSYLLGFLHADGTLGESTRNRGKVSVELSKRDEGILKKFKKLVPVNSAVRYRTRDTNFKLNHNSVVWECCDLGFRNKLKSWGMPVGKKSHLIQYPTGVIERDYWRGYIDGDGSLGFTARQVPFLSTVISSDALKDAYNNLIFRLTGQQKVLSRNKRDSVYNIMLNVEDAQKVVQYLYYPNCFGLDRKIKCAKMVLAWKRPDSMLKIENRKLWTLEQDLVVVNNDTKSAMKLLDRSEKSIKSRKWRLSYAL